MRQDSPHEFGYRDHPRFDVHVAIYQSGDKKTIRGINDPGGFV
jgi:hypothetical protein